MGKSVILKLCVAAHYCTTKDFQVFHETFKNISPLLHNDNINTLFLKKLYNLMVLDDKTRCWLNDITASI